MKLICILLLSLVFSLNLTGQSLQPTTFVSAANSEVQGNAQISWVLGEVFTGAFGAGGSQISQGSTSSDTLLTHSRLLSLPALKIYPNPAQSWLRVSGIEHAGSWSGKVFTLLGAKVLDQKLSAYSTNELSLQHLAVGTYLLILSSDAGDYFPIQFIKE